MRKWGEAGSQFVRCYSGRTARAAPDWAAARMWALAFSKLWSGSRGWRVGCQSEDWREGEGAYFGVELDECCFILGRHCLGSWVGLGHYVFCVKVGFSHNCEVDRGKKERRLVERGS